MSWAEEKTLEKYVADNVSADVIKQYFDQCSYITDIQNFHQEYGNNVGPGYSGPEYTLKEVNSKCLIYGFYVTGRVYTTSTSGSSMSYTDIEYKMYLDGTLIWDCLATGRYSTTSTSTSSLLRNIEFVMAQTNLMTYEWTSTYPWKIGLSSSAANGLRVPAPKSDNMPFKYLNGTQNKYTAGDQDNYGQFFPLPAPIVADGFKLTATGTWNSASTGGQASGTPSLTPKVDWWVMYKTLN